MVRTDPNEKISRVLVASGTRLESCWLKGLQKRERSTAEGEGVRRDIKPRHRERV